MIIDGLLSIFIAAGEGIAGLLPDADTLALDGFGQAVTAFKAFDAGLPVTETLAMGLACLTIIGGIFVTRLVIMARHFFWPF